MSSPCGQGSITSRTIAPGVMVSQTTQVIRPLRFFQMAQLPSTINMHGYMNPPPSLRYVHIFLENRRWVGSYECRLFLALSRFIHPLYHPPPTMLVNISNILLTKWKLNLLHHIWQLMARALLWRG